MESYEHNYHNQDPVLENNVDGSSHVVLTNQDSTENQLRRRPHTGIQTAQKLQAHSSHAHPKSPKRIPKWLWAVIAKSLGIKTFATEKPYLSSVLHLLTLASAIRKFEANPFITLYSKKPQTYNGWIAKFLF